MGDTVAISVGNKGRIVVPIDVRERHGWAEGTVLIGIDTPSGLLLQSRDAVRATIRHQLAGHDVVQELVDERRAEVRRDGDPT